MEIIHNIIEGIGFVFIIAVIGAYSFPAAIIGYAIISSIYKNFDGNPFISGFVGYVSTILALYFLYFIGTFI